MRTENIYLIVGAIAVAFWLSGAAPLADGIQLTLLVGAVALLGLPHGALDLLVARDLGLWNRPVGLSVFLGVYALIALAALGVWLILPAAALVAFLSASAWHFGEDWTKAPLSRLLQGAALLSAPALAQTVEVEAIYRLLVGEHAAVIVEAQVLAAAPLMLLALWDIGEEGQRAMVARLVLTYLLALVLQPLLFFAIYFCALHSPRHIADMIERLRISRSLLLGAGWLTLATIAAGAVAFYLLTPRLSEYDAALQVTFIGLAALTVPHMLLLERFSNEPDHPS